MRAWPVLLLMVLCIAAASISFYARQSHQATDLDRDKIMLDSLSSKVNLPDTVWIQSKEPTDFVVHMRYLLAPKVVLHSGYRITGFCIHREEINKPEMIPEWAGKEYIDKFWEMSDNNYHYYVTKLFHVN